MCEWNYNADGSPKEGRRGRRDDVLYLRRLVWHLTPWRHGPDCRWMRLLRS